MAEEKILTTQEVGDKVAPFLRKYDWATEQFGYGVKVIVTDGEKTASVVITGDEDIEAEAKRLVEAVDAHEYGDLDG